MKYADQFGFTPEDAMESDAFLIRTRTPVNAALIPDGSKVKLVATATIGMDQIDRGFTDSRGIEVCNAPGCNAPGVAQYVWSCLLRMGFDPDTHTLGVVGKGNIGSIVTDWGRKMGARVLVCDPPRAEAGNTDEDYLTLEEMLPKVDAVTFHTPMTKSGPHPTYHAGTSHTLGLLRPGALLVNAARGPVVDNQALKQALRSGRLRAAVDTWEGEPHIDPELLALADYATFHIAGYSRQGKQRATRMVLEAVNRKFGLDADLSGLEGPYTAPLHITPESIMASYDPADDTLPLKSDPAAFDRLRHDYHYREELK